MRELFRTATPPPTRCSCSARSITSRSPPTAGARSTRPAACCGLMAAAAISRFAPTIDGLKREFMLDPDFEQSITRSLRDGRAENPGRRPDRFTTAYLHVPGELEREVRDAGFDVIGIARTRG